MSYAKLGSQCNTNMNELIDARKFFPINNGLYKVTFTSMREYPLSKDGFPQRPPKLVRSNNENCNPPMKKGILIKNSCCKK